jgi:hypothetical protein
MSREGLVSSNQGGKMEKMGLPGISGAEQFGAVNVRETTDTIVL